jgi:hypothetical protein
MAEERKEERRKERRDAHQVEEQGEQGEGRGSMYDEGGANHVADASNYVTQPTSYEIPEHMQVRGEMPDNRFTEEVLKGSEEDFGDGEESHPLENQPVMGVGPDDELPDTTGRAANRRQKNERYGRRKDRQ